MADTSDQESHNRQDLEPVDGLADDQPDDQAQDQANDQQEPIWTPPPSGRRRSRRNRISRWDRPPEPHDWRWVVGHIGRALITLGLLMFGFVAYQLWGTGLETARAQNELDSEFNEYLEDNGITVATLAPPTTTIAAPPGTTDSTDSTVATTSTTSTTSAPAVTAPVEQDYGEVHPGDGLFQLKIPSIDVDYNVVAGVTAKDLAKGPGHFPDTNLPGQLGNAAVAGHRTGHGGPFIDLDRLQPGDVIEIYTRLGDAYAYVVTDSLVVSPSDYQVVSDSNPDVATLTLITCTPKYTSKQRLVVHATLDVTRGSPVGMPTLFYGEEPTPTDATLPADDPTGSTIIAPALDEETAVPGTDSTTTDSITTDSAATASTATAAAPTTDTATTGSATADTATASETGGSSEFGGADAFSQGWLDDTAAWPQVALWAIALTAIAYGAYRLAKRFRRLYLAFLVGFVPFVVALYFFYQNVNRLLPAAI